MDEDLETMDRAQLVAEVRKLRAGVRYTQESLNKLGRKAE